MRPHTPGLGSANIDGFLIDDGWLPQHGPKNATFPHGKYPGGPSEMDRKAVRDMGLSEEDVTDMWKGWQTNIEAVVASVVAQGGWTPGAGFGSGGGWPTGGQPIGPDTASCIKQLSGACTPGGPESG